MPTLLPSVIASSHLVSRPDLIRVDDEGNVSEIATMVVNGAIFEDWESVRIYWAWAEPYAQFTFTCAEREPYPLPGEVVQLSPNDMVEIYLAGIQVISGPIITRQVAYDANQHTVQLQGVSFSWFADRSSIEHKDSDFSNQNFLQIAGSILAPTGVGYDTVGEIDNTPFEVATPSPGEKIGQFLERLARNRKIIISSLPNGKYLFVGEHQWPQVGELIEGENIKKMQCVITDESAYNQYVGRAQKQASDESHGRAASEQEARIDSDVFRPYSLQLTTLEHPVKSLAEVAKRVATEKMWLEDITVINATVTVYGWFRPLPSSVQSFAVMQTGPATGHTLWQAGDEVVVHSPMAMLYNKALKIKSVTWTQDNSGGTQTTLNVVNPHGLNGKGAPIARPKINTDAAKTPEPAAPGLTPPVQTLELAPPVVTTPRPADPPKPPPFIFDPGF